MDKNIIDNKTIDITFDAVLKREQKKGGKKKKGKKRRRRNHEYGICFSTSLKMLVIRAR